MKPVSYVPVVMVVYAVRNCRFLFIGGYLSNCVNLQVLTLIPNTVQIVQIQYHIAQINPE